MYKFRKLYYISVHIQNKATTIINWQRRDVKNADVNMENFWANNQLRIGFECLSLREFKWHGNETARSGHTTNPNSISIFSRRCKPQRTFSEPSVEPWMYPITSTWNCRRFHI